MLWGIEFLMLITLILKHSIARPDPHCVESRCNISWPVQDIFKEETDGRTLTDGIKTTCLTPKNMRYIMNFSSEYYVENLRIAIKQQPEAEIIQMCGNETSSSSEYGFIFSFKFPWQPKLNQVCEFSIISPDSNIQLTVITNTAYRKVKLITKGNVYYLRPGRIKRNTYGKTIKLSYKPIETHFTIQDTGFFVEWKFLNAKIKMDLLETFVDRQPHVFLNPDLLSIVTSDILGYGPSIYSYISFAKIVKFTTQDDDRLTRIRIQSHSVDCRSHNLTIYGKSKAKLYSGCGLVLAHEIVTAETEITVTTEPGVVSNAEMPDLVVLITPLLKASIAFQTSDGRSISHNFEQEEELDVIRQRQAYISLEVKAWKVCELSGELSEHIQIPGYSDRCGLRCNCSAPLKNCFLHKKSCSEKCSSGYTGLSCFVRCPFGYFGSDCRKKCSPNCIHGCNTTTGACSCPSGYYKQSLNCTRMCPHRCLCDEQGKCHDSCPIGFYGPYCHLKCPTFCLEGHCDTVTGTCEECKDGFYGRNCNEKCEDCEICDLSGHCRETCGSGFYGGCCDTNCSKYCQDRKCSNVKGTCHSCIDGRFGLKCERHCNGCKKCKQTGKCIFDTTQVSKLLSLFLICLFICLVCAMKIIFCHGGYGCDYCSMSEIEFFNEY